MRDLLAANAFFIALAVVAGGLLLAGWEFFTKALHLDPAQLRIVIGFWSLASIVITGVAAYHFLKCIERRR